MNYRIDENLKSFLENKTISIVGPSFHLLNSSMGKKIDLFDFVCRCNDIFPWGYEKDYGEKYNILSLNCGTIDLLEFEKRFDFLIQNKEIKPEYLLCSVVKALGPDKWQEWNNEYISPVVDNLNKLNKYQIPSSWIGLQNYRILYNQLGSEPNSGFSTITWLLQYPIRELFITGFSFYSNANYSHLAYRPGYDYRGNESYKTGEFSHPQFQQKYFFKNVIMKKYGDRIIVDSFLNNLLDLKHNRVVNV